jgi:phosphoglycolate phosphatase-like HAD superfamily hydrolase
MGSTTGQLSFLIVVLLALCQSQAFVVMVGHKENTALSMQSSAVFADVKAVIFDIDGTLSDSFRLGYDATKVVLKNNKVADITENDYHDFTIYATPERMARHTGVFRGDDNYEEVSTRLGKEFDDLYIGLVSVETAGFYPGVTEMIDGIPEDVKVGALTNAANQYAHAVLKVNSAADGKMYARFSSIRGADDVPAAKPSPDGLFVVCDDMGGVDPASCVYIGDSPSDGAAAKNAGMAAIGVLWGSHSEEKVRAAPFDHVCDSMESLRALLPQITKAC